MNYEAVKQLIATADATVCCESDLCTGVCDECGPHRFSAIVVAWLARPEVERAVHRVLVDPAIQGCPDVSISECVVFALRQLAEQEGK